MLTNPTLGCYGGLWRRRSWDERIIGGQAEHTTIRRIHWVIHVYGHHMLCMLCLQLGMLSLHLSVVSLQLLRSLWWLRVLLCQSLVMRKSLLAELLQLL